MTAALRVVARGSGRLPFLSGPIAQFANDNGRPYQYQPEWEADLTQDELRLLVKCGLIEWSTVDTFKLTDAGRVLGSR